MKMFRSKNKLVLIRKEVIFRSLLKEEEVSPQNKWKYKPYVRSDGSHRLKEPYKFRDLKYPKHTFSIITDKLTVVPQKGDQIGELGIVEKRELYFRSPKYPPLTNQSKKIQRKNGNLYDIKLTLKPIIQIFFGETFNDCDIEDVKSFYEVYWSMYEKGWDNFGKKEDNEFWNDWGKELSEKGLFDD